MDGEKPRIYGQWAGNPKGVPEDETRCIESIWGMWDMGRQCLRKRGHGPEGLYCKQHGKIARGRAARKG